MFVQQPDLCASLMLSPGWQELCTVPAFDWVLLGSGKPINGLDMWQPLHAACLHTHLAS